MLILSLHLFANLAQSSPKPLLLVTDRTLDSEVVKAIKLSADPAKTAGEKGFTLRETEGATFARVPDIFRLETALDRVAAGRELAQAARSGDGVIRVKELTPAAQRGLLDLSSESWSPAMRALLFRKDAAIGVKSHTSVWFTVDGKTIPGSIRGDSSRDTILNNAPPTEEEKRLLEAYRKPASTELSKLEFVFVNPGTSDAMVEFCADESKALAEELRAQNKQLLDARSNLALASGKAGYYKVGDPVKNYPELAPAILETMKFVYEQLGFKSLSEIEKGMETAKIEGTLASISVGMTVTGNPGFGSWFQLRINRY